MTHCPRCKLSWKTCTCRADFQWRSADYVRRVPDVSWETLDVIDDLLLAARMVAIHESALRVRARRRLTRQPNPLRDA